MCGGLPGPLPSEWCERLEGHACKAERGLDANWSEKAGQRVAGVGNVAYRKEEGVFSATDEQLQAGRQCVERGHCASLAACARRIR